MTLPILSDRNTH